MAEPKLVRVEWLDARTISDQLTIDEIPLKCKLVRRVTVGHLWVKDREKIVVGSTYDPPDDFDREGGADFDVIPRAWVQRITDLKEEPSNERSGQNDG